MGDGAARYCRVHARFTLTATPHVRQGHILASIVIGDCYYWGKGVAIDYPRAMAAYKIAAEAGDATSQHQLGMMYYVGLGVAVDYEQAPTAMAREGRGSRSSRSRRPARGDVW